MTKVALLLIWRVLKRLINRRRSRSGLPPLNWEEIPFDWSVDWLMDDETVRHRKHTVPRKRSKKNV